MNDRPSPAWSPVLAAALGGLFFFCLVGPRVVDPTEAGWAMRGDWQWHFLGWHFFRHEPWHLPPGEITTYLEPVGSALGFTDSIPLAAFALKPFAAWLPNPFNYLGLWFWLNYTLQGFFGALVLRVWTPAPAPQILGGFLLVLFPTLLARMAHPALASHWLILWALWLYWRAVPRLPRRDWIDHGAIGIVGGLVHPYLAVMVVAVLGALLARRLFTANSQWRDAVVAMTIAIVAVGVGWWASGLFTISSSADLISGGVDRYSMNLLGPITPAGRSYFLPDLPVISIDQIGEGYQYLGAGVLLITVTASIAAVAGRRPPSWSAIPLLVMATACALYSLSPRITFADRVLVDWTDRFGNILVFRTSGRFFWPAAYALAAASAGYVARACRASIATPILAGAVLLQAADLQTYFLTVHNGAYGNEFFVWNTPLRSPEWGTLLSGYRHIKMYSPEVCRGPMPAPLASVAYLAGLHGVGLNDGFAARLDRDGVYHACARLRDDFENGRVEDDVVYLIAPSFLAEFERNAGGAAICRVIDGVPACYSTRRKPQPR